MKTILLISPNILPIPAVKGGAIETLITNLLDVNESEQCCRFIVTSCVDSAANRNGYQKSSVLYLFDGRRCVGKLSLLLGLLWVIYRSAFVLANNRLFRRLFKTNRREIGKRTFIYAVISRLYNADVIVNEGGLNESEAAYLRDSVGDENIFNHVHYSRKEDIVVRNAIPNSICISEYVRRQWAATPGIPGRNVVLHNGIDLSLFGIKPDLRARIRGEICVDTQETLVVFCGRIMRAKGIEQLLRAFELLKDEPIKLLLIGSAEFDNGKETVFSNRMVEKACCMKNVIPVGYIPNHNMPEYYQAADIQVIPSICQEGAGLVAIEGMASGLPLITTISGGITEYVSDDTAIQLPINDRLPENLADAIQELAHDPERRRRMGKAGRERAKLFSKEAYYRNYIDIVLGKE